MKNLVLLLFALPLYATVVIQKNGDIVTGLIKEEKSDRYVLQSPYGKLIIKKSDISRLIYDEKTIELTTITHEGQSLKARLIAEERDGQVFLTEDGRTIRKNNEADNKPLGPAAERKRNILLVSVGGDYGHSSFQQFGAAQSSGAMPPFEQGLHSKTYGLRISLHSPVSRFFGLGVTGSAHRWSDTLFVDPPAPAPAFDVTTTHSAWYAAPSLMLSLLGHLGATERRHDLRLEASAGASWNSAEMRLDFKTPLNGFPAEARAAGNSLTPAAQLLVYYLFALNDSVRLKLGMSYSRIFYGNVFDRRLQGGEAMPGYPGGFSGDFEKNLAAAAENPQLITAVLGIEIGF